MQLAPGDSWAGYARTVVEILRPGLGHLVVRPARPGEVGAWPWVSRQPVHVLTAWDPGDERPGDADNRIRQAALEAELRPLATAMWIAMGHDPVTGHREEGVAVRGVPEDAVVALGRRYRQDAVFGWSPAEWAIVACFGERRVVLGWSFGAHDAQP
jgi:hypothetical protein